MSVRFDRPFRAAVAGVRSRLRGRERDLFDLLCAAGQLGYRLPDDDVNVRNASGRRDPRKRLLRDFHAGGSGKRGSVRGPGRIGRGMPGWLQAGRRLAEKIRHELAAREGDEEYRALRVLLAYAPGALAPDCVVPTDPVLRAAWKTIVSFFADLFPSTLHTIGRIEGLDPRKLAALKRDAAPGMRIGRTASGRRPGVAGRRLAVDPRLLARVAKSLGRKVLPGYQARYLFYAKAGDHIWPHPDDPKYSVSVLICIDHELPPGVSSGSAFLAYRPDGTIDRHELAPGSALAVAPGLVHAREPVRRGERILMLSIALTTPDGPR